MGIKSRGNFAPCQNMSQEEWDKIFKVDNVSNYNKSLNDSDINIPDDLTNIYKDWLDNQE